MAENQNPNDIVSQDGALIGDEAVAGAAHKVEPEVNDTTVDAQVAPERQAAADKVSVREVSVQMDRAVLDPSSPEAVQIPDAGRGSLDLPIHRLNAQTVEDVFRGDSGDSQPEPAPAPAPRSDES